MVLAAGVDSNADVHPILVDANGRPYVLLSDGTDTLAINGAGQAEVVAMAVLPDGVHNLPSGDAIDRPIFITPGRQESFHVHLCKDGIGADTGLMLIDLSDTVNWPHALTGGIRIIKVCMSIAASKLADTKVAIGFLSNVDATDGDFNEILCWDVGFPGTNEPRDIDTCFDYSLFPYTVGAANWFGPTSADNALFQTDVNLRRPDGNVNAPSGDGDLVIYVDWTAGELDISCSVDYETFA